MMCIKIELMNQKVRDFELILDENQNEHIESIKNLKIDLENYKKSLFLYSNVSRSLKLVNNIIHNLKQIRNSQ